MLQWWFHFFHFPVVFFWSCTLKNSKISAVLLLHFFCILQQLSLLVAFLPFHPLITSCISLFATWDVAAFCPFVHYFCWSLGLYWPAPLAHFSLSVKVALSSRVFSSLFLQHLFSLFWWRTFSSILPCYFSIIEDLLVSTYFISFIWFHILSYLELWFPCLDTCYCGLYYTVRHERPCHVDDDYCGVTCSLKS